MINYLTCYRGSVEAWEIDHMGHMNVQFYLKKAIHAINIFFIQNNIKPGRILSFEDSFTLRKSHLRFLAEQRAGSPLFADVGINSLDQQSFTLTVVIKELLTQSPSASFSFLYKIKEKNIKKIQCLLKKAYQKYPFPIPEYGKRKGLKISKSQMSRSIKIAKKLGMRETYLGIASREFTEDNQTMGPANYMSIISNAVPNILEESLSKVNTIRFGGAALEYSFDYENFAEMGTPISIRSGLADLGDKTFTWRHWIFNATTEKFLAEAEALVITLDLVERKSASIPKKMYKALKAILIDFN